MLRLYLRQLLYEIRSHIMRFQLLQQRVHAPPHAPASHLLDSASRQAAVRQRSRHI